MAVIVITVTGPAADLRWLAVQQRDDGVVCNALAFDAEIVDNISKTHICHRRPRLRCRFRQYSEFLLVKHSTLGVEFGSQPLCVYILNREILLRSHFGSNPSRLPHNHVDRLHP
jgi:hypothetical protein